MEALAGDVMTGAGGVAGLAPDVRHEPPGDKQPKKTDIYRQSTHFRTKVITLVA